MKQILYYTDNRLDEHIMKMCQDKLLESGIPIVSVSLEPIDFGNNIVFDGKRGYLTMFKQIYIGLQYCTADQIFMCEHDVLYHPRYFDYDIPTEDAYYYNINTVKYKPGTKEVVGYDSKWLSQMTASRNILLMHYRWRIPALEAGWKIRSEPGARKHTKDHEAIKYRSKYTNIDIRHGKNLTGVSRFDKGEFRNELGCPNFKKYKLEDLNDWDLELLKSI